MSYAQFAAIVGEPVNSESHAHVVEKNIAALEDRFAQVHNTVGALAVDPAFELPSIKCRIPGTKRREAFRRDVVFQHSRGRYDFENRSRRKLRLNRAIQQRMQGVFVELPPLLTRNANGEIIRVGRGATDHGKYLAGSRIKRHHRTWSCP